MNPQTEQLEAALPTDKAMNAKHWRWLPVRTLSERHRQRVLAHLLALDEQDRHLRFGHVASDEQLGHYVAQLNFERDQIFGVFDDQLVLVAMAHLAFNSDPDQPGMAEFGVSVHPRLRGQGIGGRLFHHAVTHARNRGAKSMAIHIARENTSMLSIVRRAGAQISFDGAEAVAHLGLPSDTLGTQIGALVESQAADLDYRIKLQVLRLDRLWPNFLHSGKRDD